MSSGLLGLFDDVAALAKLAAASIDDVGAAAGRASVKAAGVVVDDTAVTPAYVHGLAADRELPIIKRIAKGSLKNKLLYIIPVALVLSEFVPVLVEIVLMIGGAYLCFEGAEKIHHRLAHHDDGGAHDLPASALGPEQEEQTVAGAIRTDFILSGEIIVIALKDVLDQGFVSRAIILVVVAVLITAVVYGVVALIVKMDDVGLRMAQSARPLGAADRARARHRHAQAAGRAVRRRDRRDALGRRAHPARRRRRARMARALRPRAPPRGPGSRRGRHRRRARAGSSTRWPRRSSGSPSARSSWSIVSRVRAARSDSSAAAHG